MIIMISNKLVYCVVLDCSGNILHDVKCYSILYHCIMLYYIVIVGRLARHRTCRVRQT